MKKLTLALAALGAPLLTFAEGETTSTSFDMATFWAGLNIDFNALITQGATILGTIMITVVGVALVFRVVTAGIAFAKRAFGR